MDINRRTLSMHTHMHRECVRVRVRVCVFKSMTQPCKHQLLSGLYALPKPQLGEHVKLKRPLGPTGVGFLPLESITQVQIDGE